MEACVAVVKQLKGITATYRMTTKGPPTRHSHYVTGGPGHLCLRRMRFADTAGASGGCCLEYWWATGKAACWEPCCTSCRPHAHQSPFRCVHIHIPVSNHAGVLAPLRALLDSPKLASCLDAGARGEVARNVVDAVSGRYQVSGPGPGPLMAGAGMRANAMLGHLQKHCVRACICWSGAGLGDHLTNCLLCFCGLCHAHFCAWNCLLCLCDLLPLLA